MKTAPEDFPGTAADKCLLALTRQPLRRSGQPKAAAPDSCVRVASAAGEWSCIHGKATTRNRAIVFPAHSAGNGAASASGVLAGLPPGVPVSWSGTPERRKRLRHGGTTRGINGGSSGKDGVITLGDHALVFSELRQVTCGLAVHTAVHNRRDVRITGGILWTKCGHGKTQNEFRWGSCVTRAEGVKILSPQETGTIWGFPLGRGKGRETGIYRGCLAPAGRRVAPGSPGNRTNRNSVAGRPVDLDR